MPTCRKCHQVIFSKLSHRKGKGCDAVDTEKEEQVILPKVNPKTEQQLEQITEMLGTIIDRQKTVEKRLDKMEHPDFKSMPAAPRETTINELETNLAIAIATQVQEGEDQPVCAFGIHYPSDFGQKRVNGTGAGPLTKPTKRCFSAPPALQKIVDEILTSEFGADVLPDPYNSTFQFSIVVPQKYCVMDDYRSGAMKDVRVKVISNYAAEPEVRVWCDRVKKKIFEEHTAAHLPSPFTVPSMRQELVVPAVKENYTVTQVS